MIAAFDIREVLGAGDLAHGAAIRDLLWADRGGGLCLYALSGAGGGLTALALGPGSALESVGERALGGGFLTGAEPRLRLLDLAGGPVLVVGAATATEERSVALTPSGGFGPGAPLTGDPAPLPAASVLNAGGATLIAAARADGTGLALWEVSATGALVPRATLADGAATALAGVSATAAVARGESAILVAASGGEDAAAFIAVGPDGDATYLGEIGAEDGLGLAAPASVETMSLGGRDFALVAGQGSNSLSVIEILSDGSPVLRDHVIDDRATRFDAPEAIDAIVLSGRGFAVAGGADDGLTLFALSPGGRLIALGNLADSLGTTLTGLSALSLAETGGRLQIAAAGLGDPGLTRIEVDLASLGETRRAPEAGGALTGTAGDDLLEGAGGIDVLGGGPGDDILIDGGGSDVLTGGAGRDLFVLVADGETDRITDFEPGIDRLDLSSWGLLYTPGQLAATPEGWGVRLAFGDEVLDLERAGGGPIDISGWAVADIVNLDRPLVLSVARVLTGTSGGDTLAGGEGDDTLTGLAGDDVIDAAGGADLVRAGTGNDRVLGGTGDDRLFGDAGFDRIEGGAGQDRIWGGDQADVLTGGAGDDVIWGEGGIDDLSGGEGADRLFGGPCADRLAGGPGPDELHGDTGEDRLHGDAGNDRLFGGAGLDELRGGDGDDALFGGPQADSLYGEQGQDRLFGEDGADRLFGGGGDDTLHGGRENDILWGGTGSDLLQGDTGEDLLFGEGGDDRLLGGAGFDRLEGGAGNDWLSGGPQADALFGDAGDDLVEGDDGLDRLFGGSGDDHLMGGAGADRLLGGSGDDILEGGDGDDVLFGNAGFDILIGGAGNDVLQGDFNADTFVFADGCGADRITDFEAANPFEKLDLSGLTAIADLADLYSDHLTEGPDHLLIDAGGGDSIRLDGVSLGDLDASDFIF